MRKLTPLALEDFATQPLRISGTAKLDADPIAVFAELGDPSLWFPFMRRSIWKTGATSGVGAEREIKNALLGTARERMLAWDTGERVAFTMLEVSSPLVDQMGEQWLLSRDGIYTRVDWELVATPSRIGRALIPAMRPMLRAMFTRACTNIQKRAGSFRAESRGKHVS